MEYTKLKHSLTHTYTHTLLTTNRPNKCLGNSDTRFNVIGPNQCTKFTEDIYCIVYFVRPYFEIFYFKIMPRAKFWTESLFIAIHCEDGLWTPSLKVD